MTYTWLSARYANADNSAVIAKTVEAGDVVLSLEDRPEEWADLQAWGTPDPYVPPPSSPDLKDEWSKAATTAAKLAVVGKALGFS